MNSAIGITFTLMTYASADNCQSAYAPWQLKTSLTNLNCDYDVSPNNNNGQGGDTPPAASLATKCERCCEVKPNTCLHFHQAGTGTCDDGFTFVAGGPGASGTSGLTTTVSSFSTDCCTAITCGTAVSQCNAGYMLDPSKSSSPVVEIPYGFEPEPEASANFNVVCCKARVPKLCDIVCPPGYENKTDYSTSMCHTTPCSVEVDTDNCCTIMMKAQSCSLSSVTTATASLSLENQRCGYTRTIWCGPTQCEESGDLGPVLKYTCKYMVEVLGMSCGADKFWGNYAVGYNEWGVLVFNEGEGKRGRDATTANASSEPEETWMNSTFVGACCSTAVKAHAATSRNWVIGMAVRSGLLLKMKRRLPMRRRRQQSFFSCLLLELLLEATELLQMEHNSFLQRRPQSRN